MTSGLYIWGGLGKGKSWLASELARRWIMETARPARYVKWAWFLDQLRDSYHPGAAPPPSFAAMCRVPFLVLDDLGMERPTAWACERLVELADERLARARATVWTSNLSLDALEKRLVDALTVESRTDPRADPLQALRITERIREQCGPWIVEMDGAKLRLFW